MTQLTRTELVVRSTSHPRLKRLELVQIQGHVENLAHHSATTGQTERAGTKTQVSTVQTTRRK